jgi:anti-sigma factor RsiW
MTDRDKLLLYVDGNLSAEDRREIEARIAEDAEFRAEYDLLRHVQRRLSKRPMASSPGLWDGIQEQIQEESIWNSLVWAGKRLVPLAAAAAVIFMVLMDNGSTEANTVSDYFDSQTEMVLSEVQPDSLIIYPE